MLNSIKSLFMFCIMAGLFTGCGSSGDSNSAPTQMAVATAVLYTAPASACANGGITVESGIDTNGNSRLDPSEVTNTQYVCNGANGTDGMTALLSMITESPGSNCMDGGTKLNAGLDANRDGLLDDAEVTSASYVCNGSPGIHNSLIFIVTEPFGSNCSNGGLKISSGLDVDDSRVLDPDEVTSTSYVCTPSTSTVPTLTSISVVPANSSISSGATQQFAAIGKFSDDTTEDLTAQVTWTTGDATKATITSSGLATGVAFGSTTVTASLADVSASTTISVKPSFQAGVNYSSSSIYVGNTAVGDLNGDGRNDVVAIQSHNTPDSFLIYYQNSGGTLNTAIVVTTGFQVKGVDINDVNNDGLADLVIIGDSSSSGFPGKLAVYRQNPISHAFDSPQEYTLSATNTGPLAIADINDDGRLDIISAGTDTSGNGIISMLFQQADGSLGSENTYTGTPVAVAGELHVADMNNDGLNDIVLQSANKQLAVVKQVSPGIFSTTPDYYQVQTSYWPYFQSFALGDLNGDGLTDVAVADPANSPDLNIFYQNTSGTLTGPTIMNFAINNEDEVDIADIDGDGLNDLIIINGGNTVSILYQSSDHTFLAPMTYYLPTYSSGGTSIHQAMSIADINNDGLLDIVAAWSNEGIFILPQKP